MTPPDAATQLATWTQPGTSLAVSYPVALFHEIDFLVNEGYRRIPHGGIEVGGLVFGRVEEDAVRIQAFRMIECEHAAGPSFILSERDVAALGEQIAKAAGDPELEGLEAIGWFIAHTRSPLIMNDREASLFDAIFPGASKLTLLVKPERFKPTLFAFLVRGESGAMLRDGTQHAFILPLPGRAGRGADEVRRETEMPRNAPQMPSPVIPPREPATAVDAQETVREHVRNPTTPIEFPAPPRNAMPVETETDPELADAGQADPAEEPPAAAPKPQYTDRRGATGFAPARAARVVRDDTQRSNAQFALILFISAVLGCAVGYWAYLQLPSAVIPLTISIQPPGVTVSWPAEQTRKAAYAAMRINDGEPVLLSSKDKEAANSRVNASGDNLKIELIVRHWMRDSRGIVRFVRAGVRR
ncbi:MAG: hypothetical protein JOZ62_00020 [Acidobacteriaceae bacterium]|nr:hypothetical protein [Acidobacteriaceae bacterium]